MSERRITSRIIHKHDIASNWAKATSFIPQQGEIIVYDIDDTYNYERLKIGDGITNVNALPFVDDAVKATVDDALSTTSINPVQNKVVSTAIGNLEILVGEVSVAEQISAAIENINIPQSDWNQNDSTASDYVKNRTHWAENIPTVFVDNQTLSFTAQSETMYMHSSAIAYEFSIGNMFRVIWDGVDYNCLCFEYQGVPVIGNINIVGAQDDNATEPFLMYVNNGSLLIATSSTSENHTVSISGDAVVYHIIDNKYLPPLIGQAGTGLYSEIFNDHIGNIASGEYSHSEGVGTRALGNRSHAEGWATEASGYNAHAEGSFTDAVGTSSHAEGSDTIATGDYQHVQGKYNIEDENSKYAHIVGNGIHGVRSNAHTLDWSGNAWFAGDVKTGGTGQDDASAKTLATTEYVDTQISAIPVPDIAGQIEAHNASETAHEDIRTSVSNLNTLVGDKSVATQISNAISNKADVNHTHDGMSTITIKTWTSADMVQVG